MTDEPDDKRDFFISFNQADRAWAAWIAWVLEEAGYSVFFQHWDFKGNFVLEMDKAHSQSRRTIAVLSPDYLSSRFTAPEWAARFAEDATSQHDRLIPIRVRPCALEGLLAPIVHVDLVGCDEAAARKRLLDRVSGIRTKPDEPPLYPGSPAEPRAVPERPNFPGPYKPEKGQKKLKRILARITILLLAVASLALLLVIGWNYPLRYFYSLWELALSSDLPIPPAVTPPKSLTFFGSRDNNNFALRFETAESKRFEMDTGIKVNRFNPGEDDRLSTLRKAWKPPPGVSPSEEFDAVMIDIIWIGELAPHLINLQHYFEEEIDLFKNMLIKNNTVDKQLVALPWFQNIGLLFYRKDLLEKYELNVPRTWGQLEEAAKKIQDQQGQEKESNEQKGSEFIGFAWQGAKYEGLTCNALEWIASWGALDEKTGLPDFDDLDLLKNALDHARMWVKGENAISDYVTGYMEERSLEKFLDGKAAFLRAWSNEYARISEEFARLKQSGKSMSFGVAPLPSGRGDKSFSVLGGWQLAVPKYSLSQRSAIEFIRYLSSPEVQKWRAREGTYQRTIEVDMEEDLTFLTDHKDRKIELIIRPSSVLGDRYTSVSECIYGSVSSALDRNSGDEIIQDIKEMENCIESRSKGSLRTPSR